MTLHHFLLLYRHLLHPSNIVTECLGTCNTTTCVTEVEAIQIDNYYLFRHDRKFTVNGGGLITYISNKWTVSRPKVCLTLSNPDIELLAVRAHPRYLLSNISNITIINVYTRPQANCAVTDAELKKARS